MIKSRSKRALFEGGPTFPYSSIFLNLDARFQGRFENRIFRFKCNRVSDLIGDSKFKRVFSWV